LGIAALRLLAALAGANIRSLREFPIFDSSRIASSASKRTAAKDCGLWIWRKAGDSRRRLTPIGRLHQLRETEIGEQTLREMERLLAAAGDSAPQANGVLLDLGCGTGGLLAAAGRRFSLVAGVDVAFRWLLVGRLRLREAGVDAALICANAEYLPFAPARAGCVTANDLLEHVADPAAVLAECRRVTASGGHCYLSTNNRYSLAPEPHVQVWGVGFLARGLQARYVQAARGHSYRNLGLLSGTELRRFAERAGLACGGIEPAPLFARHLGGSLERLAGVYNSVRLTPLLRPFLGLVGPRVQAVCRPR
jgi:SAM-dependent methyltransferase